MNDAWQIGHRVYPVYRELGDLAFVYGQGSAFAGFSEDGGVDLVAVWDRTEPPPPQLRPLDKLHLMPATGVPDPGYPGSGVSDPGISGSGLGRSSADGPGSAGRGSRRPHDAGGVGGTSNGMVSRPGRAEMQVPVAPVRLHHPGIGLVRDSFSNGGREVSVSHVTMADVKRWIGEVQAGQGWERVVRPTPLYAVAGLVYGTLLYDGEGHGAAWREDLRQFPEELIERSRNVLSSDLRTYQDDLSRCAKVGDGWLFHELFGDLLRHALVAWFAAERRYCPYPKWVRYWVSRFGLNHSIAALERGLWAPPVSLQHRYDLFGQMCRRILAL